MANINITQVTKSVAISSQFPNEIFSDPARPINVRELRVNSGELTEDYLEIVIDGKRHSTILVNPKFVG